MIIVVEGPNNVGKTTFINEFVKKYKDFTVVHTDGNTPNDYEYYSKCLNNHLNTDVNIIYDRLHVGEMVYPELYGRKAKITKEEYEILCKNYNNVIYVFIDADIVFKRQGFINKNETLNIDEVISEATLFTKYYNELKHTNKVYHIYNSLDTIENNINYLLNAISKDINSNYLTKGYAEDAGLDIALKKKVTFEPKSVKCVDLDVVITPIKNTMSYLVSRTSAAAKGIYVASCPIDANYRGTINAIVYNFSDEQIVYEKNEAFCQLVTVPIVKPNCKYKVKKKGKRSYGKFGSTNNS